MTASIDRLRDALHGPLPGHDHHALIGNSTPNDFFQSGNRAAQIALVALHRREDAVRRRKRGMLADNRPHRRDGIRA